MAILYSTNEAKIALKKGATWGTEADITSGGLFLYANNVTVSGGFDNFTPNDIGFAGKPTQLKRLSGSFNVSITCDTTFNQSWLALLGALMGTESSPTETTGGQGDYLRNFDLADSNVGLFYTLGWKIETDRTLFLPSVKIQSFKMEGAVNANPKISFTGICDLIVESATNLASEIDALTPSAYESAIFGGADPYFRANAQGGAGLSSGVNIPVSSFSVELTRALQTRYTLRGANSYYTIEPLQLGDIQCFVSFKISELDNATYDSWGIWAAQTEQKAEIYMAGAAIGTGIKRSIKMQFPRLSPTGEIPSGHDISGPNSLFEPSIRFQALKASSAPTGMTGVTDLIRVASVDLRSTKWTA